jgi:hypothetical protein
MGGGSRQGNQSGGAIYYDLKNIKCYPHFRQTVFTHLLKAGNNFQEGWNELLPDFFRTFIRAKFTTPGLLTNKFSTFTPGLIHICGKPDGKFLPGLVTVKY